MLYGVIVGSAAVLVFGEAFGFALFVGAVLFAVVGPIVEWSESE